MGRLCVCLGHRHFGWTKTSSPSCVCLHGRDENLLVKRGQFVGSVRRCESGMNFDNVNTGATYGWGY
jgi:hypothetical protein